MQPFQIAALYAAEQPYLTTLQLGPDGFDILSSTQRSAIDFSATDRVPFSATEAEMKAAIDGCIARVNERIAAVEDAAPHVPNSPSQAFA